MRRRCWEIAARGKKKKSCKQEARRQRLIVDFLDEFSRNEESTQSRRNAEPITIRKHNSREWRGRGLPNAPPKKQKMDKRQKETRGRDAEVCCENGFTLPVNTPTLTFPESDLPLPLNAENKSKDVTEALLLGIPRRACHQFATR